MIASMHQLILALNWKPALGANTYRLQVSTDSTFATNIIYDDSTLADTFTCFSLCHLLQHIIGV